MISLHCIQANAAACHYFFTSKSTCSRAARWASSSFSNVSNCSGTITDTPKK